MTASSGSRVDGKPAVYGDRNSNVSDGDYLINADLRKKTDSIPVWDQQLNGQQAADTNLNA